MIYMPSNMPHLVYMPYTKCFSKYGYQLICDVVSKIHEIYTYTYTYVCTRVCMCVFERMSFN
jgi:hypothetical protein